LAIALHTTASTASGTDGLMSEMDGGSWVMWAMSTA
jgi:hypothetical protein